MHLLAKKINNQMRRELTEIYAGREVWAWRNVQAFAHTVYCRLWEDLISEDTLLKTLPIVEEERKERQ